MNFCHQHSTSFSNFTDHTNHEWLQLICKSASWMCSHYITRNINPTPQIHCLTNNQQIHAKNWQLKVKVGNTCCPCSTSGKTSSHNLRFCSSSCIRSDTASSSWNFPTTFDFFERRRWLWSSSPSSSSAARTSSVFSISTSINQLWTGLPAARSEISGPSF